MGAGSCVEGVGLGWQLTEGEGTGWGEVPEPGLAGPGRPKWPAKQTIGGSFGPSFIKKSIKE